MGQRVPILFLDLTTGEVSLAKMPDQQPLELGEDMSVPYIEMGVWDPLEPAYLYASILNYIDENNHQF